MISWPIRRSAMGDVTLSLLDGKPRVAEDVFAGAGLRWNWAFTNSALKSPASMMSRRAESQGLRIKIQKLLADIVEIMTPHCQAESRLKTTFSYTDLTAKAVYEFLLEKGWCEEELPTLRTISNILNRQGYRLRTVAKAKVQKKRRTRTRSSRMSEK